MSTSTTPSSPISGISAPLAAAPAAPVEAATGHEPLAVRVANRCINLKQALELLDPADLRGRNDIEAAIASAEALGTGDSEHPSDAVAASMSAWLEQHKYTGLSARGRDTVAPTD